MVRVVVRVGVKVTLYFSLGQVHVLLLTYILYISQTGLDSQVGNMALIPNWYPPSKENYDLLLFVWYFFPVVSMDSNESSSCVKCH